MTAPTTELPALSDDQRLALRLHALSRKDRQWILERTDVETRKRLTGLLSELAALGIVVDQKTADSLASAARLTGQVDPLSSHTPDNPRPNLDRSTVEAIVADEPEGLARRMVELVCGSTDPDREAARSGNRFPNASSPTPLVRERLIAALLGAAPAAQPLEAPTPAIDLLHGAARRSHAPGMNRWMQKVLPWRR